MTDRRTYAPNRIAQLRKAKGLSLEALGLAMPSELTASTISKLEKSKAALSADYILQIADVLEVEPGEILMEGAGAARVVPVAGRIAAGNWREAVQMSDESMPIPSHIKGKSVFVLRVEGNSMDKIVQGEGGFVVVDPDQRELIDGKCYVVMNGGGETTFKKFSTSPLALNPCSTDPDHKPIPVGSEPFSVLGRVVYVGQDV